MFYSFFVLVFMLRGTFIPSKSGTGSAKVVTNEAKVATDELKVVNNEMEVAADEAKVTAGSLILPLTGKI
jgi:hypothetical protein